MGSQVGHGIVDAAAQVLHEGGGQALVIVEGHLLLQNGEVAGFPQIGIGTGHQPQGVVVEAGAHGQVALLGQGLVLMVGGAVGELGGRNIQQPLSCLFGDHVDKAQQILAGVPEAHAPAHAAFEVAGGTGHIKGDHALVLVPDVDHPVHLLVAGGGGVVGKELLPVLCQLGHGGIEPAGGIKFFHHGIGADLVDDAGCRELFLLGVLDVAQTQQNAAALPGLQGQVKLHGAHRSPAVGHGAGAAAVLHRLGQLGAAVYAHKGIPGGIKAIEGGIGPEDRIVVPALPVLGLVIDGPVGNLHLTGGEVALEVGGIVHGVPQTEFQIGEDRNRLRGFRPVGYGEAHQQAVVAVGDHHFLFGGNSVLFALQNRIAQAVTALVSIQLRLSGLPAGIPHGSVGIAHINVEAV